MSNTIVSAIRSIPRLALQRHRVPSSVPGHPLSVGLPPAELTLHYMSPATKLPNRHPTSCRLPDGSLPVTLLLHIPPAHSRPPLLRNIRATHMFSFVEEVLLVNLNDGRWFYRTSTVCKDEVFLGTKDQHLRDSRSVVRIPFC